MPKIFLSYARADGKTAAIRLRSELQRAGFEVWRDIEDMQERVIPSLICFAMPLVN